MLNVRTLTLKREWLLLLIFLLSYFIVPNELTDDFQINTVSGTENSFTEDFTSIDYQDQEITNISGWADGYIYPNLKEPSPTIIGNYKTDAYAMDVEVKGNFAYIADLNQGLQIINVTNPHAPDRISHINGLGYVKSVTVSGHYVYLTTDDNGLVIVDISKPHLPSIIDTVDTGVSREVVVDGDCAFVASLNGLKIVNITDPYSNVIVGSYYDAPKRFSSISIEGNYAFLADIDGSFHIINITDITNPTPVSTVPIFGHSDNGVYVSGDYAFVADYSAGLSIINITDLANPNLITTLQTFNNALGVFVEGDLAYIADGGAGMTVIDITDCTNPILLGSFDTPSYANNIDVYGDFAYIADHSSGLQVFRISDYIDPHTVGYNNSGSLANMLLSGNHLFIVDFPDSIRCYDITDPINPLHIATKPATEGQPYYAAIQGDYLYVTTYDTQGLRVYDISNPLDMKIVGRVNFDDSPFRITVRGNYAYIGANYRGMYIVDISDPHNPTIVSTCNTPNRLWKIALYGNYAFLADFTNYLHVVDISDPINPVNVTAFKFSDVGSAGDIVIEGNLLFLTGNNNDAMQIINITDPEHPITLSEYTGIGQGVDIDIKGDYVVICALASGFRLFNVSNPHKPVLLDTYNPSGTNYVDHVKISDDYLYIAAGEGLYVVEFKRSRVRNYEEFSVAQSTVVAHTSVSAITSVKIEPISSIPSYTSITYYLSADNGINWEEVSPTVKHTFTNPGNNLLWKAEFTTSFNRPKLYSLEITYFTNLYATTLIAPINNTCLPGYPEPIEFMWNSYSEATEYLVQISMESDFLSPLINLTFSETIYSMNYPLVEGIWYWRVATIDTEGMRGDFSSYYTFIIDKTVPSIISVENITFEQGSEDNHVNWLCEDVNPDYYEILIDGYVIKTLDWNGNDISYQCDHLILGSYELTCRVHDRTGYVTNDSLFVTVLDTTLPEINSPEDLTYEVGSTGNTITWETVELNPYQFTITRNGVNIVVKEPWIDPLITISVDSLDVGIYSYICTIYETLGNFTSDNVFVFVTESVTVDTSSPIISHPSDKSIDEGTLGETISWNVTDEHLSYYVIKRDGRIIQEANCVESRDIVVNLDYLPSGTFEYECVVYDTSGNFVSDNVTVVVHDITPPLISSPNDIIAIETEDTFLNEVIWFVYDDNPSTFKITMNGTVINQGSWIGNQIVVKIADLSPGNYTFICSIYDTEGNSATDTVMVIIIPIVSNNTSFSPLSILLLSLTTLVIFIKRKTR